MAALITVNQKMLNEFISCLKLLKDSGKHIINNHSISIPLSLFMCGQDLIFHSTHLIDILINARNISHQVNNHNAWQELQCRHQIF